VTAQPATRFLADEHIPRTVVETLRSQGIDVTWAAETGRQASDASHVATALKEKRVILTEDADFSDLLSVLAADHKAAELIVIFFLSA
jgi:predicted nuclease of predicted toxin-antitoxin system